MPTSEESAAAAPSDRRRRPWWQWLVGGLVLFVILSAIFGDENESGDQATTTVTVTQPAQPAQTQTASLPTTNISDAQQAVDDDEYAEAIAIAAALGPDQEQAIRRRIANRIAQRVRSALRSGDRGEAKRLLARADAYPTTALTRQARSSYRAARARASERARARRVAAEQRRQAAEQRRQQQAAEQAEPETGGNCDPGYSPCVPAYPPDVNCPDVNGPVQVTGSDPHGLDRDGDGVACE